MGDIYDPSACDWVPLAQVGDIYDPSACDHVPLAQLWWETATTPLPLPLAQVERNDLVHDRMCLLSVGIQCINCGKRRQRENLIRQDGTLQSACRKCKPRLSWMWSLWRNNSKPFSLKTHKRANQEASKVVISQKNVCAVKKDIDTHAIAIWNIIQKM